MMRRMCRQVESKGRRGRTQKKGGHEEYKCTQERKKRKEAKKTDEREMNGEWRRCRGMSVLTEEEQE